MRKFVRNLITEWRRLDLPFSGETAVLAISGGADSLSLMFAIDELKKRKKFDHRFIVAHFNHGFRGEESVADAEFVGRLAADLGFEFVLGRGRVKRSGNFEQNARNARYDFLRKTAADYNAFAVFTAHTVNDQAETFLMNLIRGSGMDGLRAMSAIRPLEIEKVKMEPGSTNRSEIQNPKSKITLARPLLTWAKRSDTEEFCVEVGVKYRTDVMNADPAFTRVRIRNEMIPMLASFNPRIIETLSRTANLLSIPPTAVDGSILSCEIMAEKAELMIGELKKLPQGDLYKILRSWLKNRRGNLRSLELKHIEAIERLIHSAKSGKTAELPGGCGVVKSGGRLVWQNKS